CARPARRPPSLVRPAPARRAGRATARRTPDAGRAPPGPSPSGRSRCASRPVHPGSARTAWGGAGAAAGQRSGPPVVSRRLPFLLRSVLLRSVLLLFVEARGRPQGSMLQHLRVRDRDAELGRGLPDRVAAQEA